MKNILMTRLSVCSLGVSCNEMIDTPMLLVVVCTCYFDDVILNLQGCNNLKFWKNDNKPLQ